MLQNHLAMSLSRVWFLAVFNTSTFVVVDWSHRLSRSYYTTAVWFHHMQSMIFEPKIFFICIDLSKGGTRDLPGYHSVYSSWDYRILSTFNLLSGYGVKDPFFNVFQAAVPRCLSTSLGFNSYNTQFPCFWIIPNFFKRMKSVCWVTPNAQSAFTTEVDPVKPSIPHFRTYGLPSENHNFWSIESTLWLIGLCRFTSNFHKH